jgi:rSAM/selenodomain-associated transferase 2
MQYLSIIIPTLNEAQHIGKTVRYLLQHGGENLREIIVVDGGSTDDTALLAKAAGAEVVRSPQKGRAAQMNFGAQHSRGEVLYFVHADTIPPETYMPDIAKALSNGILMGCFRYKFDSDKWMLRLNAFFTRFSFLVCQGGDKTFFIRRETFFALGGYDPGHVIMEEYEFLRRAKKAGYPISVLPCDCLVSARKYEKNSWLRVQIANFIVYNLWAWGRVQPCRLQRIYRGLLG